MLTWSSAELQFVHRLSTTINAALFVCIPLRVHETSRFGCSRNWASGVETSWSHGHGDAGIMDRDDSNDVVIPARRREGPTVTPAGTIIDHEHRLEMRRRGSRLHLYIYPAMHFLSLSSLSDQAVFALAYMRSGSARLLAVGYATQVRTINPSCRVILTAFQRQTSVCLAVTERCVTHDWLHTLKPCSLMNILQWHTHTTLFTNLVVQHREKRTLN